MEDEVIQVSKNKWGINLKRLWGTGNENSRTVNGPLRGVSEATPVVIPER